MSGRREATLEEGHRLLLGYHELRELPVRTLTRYADRIRALDITGNGISNLSGLEVLPNLEELVADDNEIKSHVRLPNLPSLRVLSANKNKIKNLEVFIDQLVLRAPGIRYLSLLQNECCKNFFNGGTPAEYKDYRLRVIIKLPLLQYLDSTEVTAEEREEARRLYGNAVSTSVVTNRRLKQKERDAKLSAAAAVVIPGARAGSIPVSASAPDPGALEFDARMREKREKQQRMVSSTTAGQQISSRPGIPLHTADVDTEVLEDCQEDPLVGSSLPPEPSMVRPSRAAVPPPPPPPPPRPLPPAREMRSVEQASSSPRQQDPLADPLSGRGAVHLGTVSISQSPCASQSPRGAAQVEEEEEEDSVEDSSSGTNSSDAGLSTEACLLSEMGDPEEWNVPAAGAGRKGKGKGKGTGRRRPPPPPPPARRARQPRVAAVPSPSGSQALDPRQRRREDPAEAGHHQRGASPVVVHAPVEQQPQPQRDMVEAAAVPEPEPPEGEDTVEAAVDAPSEVELRDLPTTAPPSRVPQIPPVPDLPTEGSWDEDTVIPESDRVWDEDSH